MSKDKQGTLFM